MKKQQTPTLKGVVPDYRADNERIVEFSGGDGVTGNISFYPDGRGGLIVSVYNCDPRVRVIASNRVGVEALTDEARSHPGDAGGRSPDQGRLDA